MLFPDKPKRDISQWSVKERPCKGGCGTPIQYQTRPKSYCEACAATHGSQSPKAIAARRSRQRRARGLLGFPFKCATCGVDGIANVPQSRWCDGCRPAARKEYDRRKNAAAGCVPFGTELSCRHCGAKYIKAARRDFYCSECRKLSAKEGFPWQLERKRKWFAGYGKARRARDPMFALNGRMKAQVVRCLASGKGGRSWPTLVGYTLKELADHLEAKFLPGMTWDNRGEWHIDHIRPLCSFNFTTPDCPQFREAWALSNLQPLWAVDNLKKGGRWAA